MSLILSNFKESPFNCYQGMNVLSVRSIDMKSQLYACIDKQYAYQCIFDAGKALKDMGIIAFDSTKGVYVLNPKFGDYGSWSSCSDIVEKNCLFMAQLGHPDFTDSHISNDMVVEIVQTNENTDVNEYIIPISEHDPV